MMSKYAIDYTVQPQHNQRVLTHRTDDPVEAQEFLIHLLAGNTRIRAIHHDGVLLSQGQFDQMLRVAAESLVSRLLENSLGLDAAATRHRFGFAA